MACTRKNHIGYITEGISEDTSGDVSVIPEESKDKIVQLSTDDELIQRLWGAFNSSIFTDIDGLGSGIGMMSSFPPLNKFYSEEGALSPDGLADIYKFAVAIQNRPLAKLGKAVKIADASNQRKAKSETDSVFNKDTLL